MSMQFLQTKLGDEPVIVEALFPASPARIFAAWTDPAKIVQWFGPTPGSLETAEADLRIGGRWCFAFPKSETGQNRLEGEYQDIQAEQRLQFTWRHVHEQRDGTIDATAYSTVTLTLTVQGAATRLHLRHEGIIKADGRKGVGTGWETTFGTLLNLLTKPET